MDKVVRRLIVFGILLILVIIFILGLLLFDSVEAL